MFLDSGDSGESGGTGGSDGSHGLKNRKFIKKSGNYGNLEPEGILTRTRKYFNFFLQMKTSKLFFRSSIWVLATVREEVSMHEVKKECSGNTPEIQMYP